jgi:hypothetical protein
MGSQIVPLAVEAYHKTNSVARILKRTIPTERPPLDGEISANFCADRKPYVTELTNLIFYALSKCLMSRNLILGKRPEKQGLWSILTEINCRETIQQYLEWNAGLLGALLDALIPYDVSVRGFRFASLSSCAHQHFHLTF